MKDKNKCKKMEKLFVFNQLTKQTLQVEASYQISKKDFNYF